MANRTKLLLIAFLLLYLAEGEFHSPFPKDKETRDAHSKNRLPFSSQQRAQPRILNNNAMPENDHRPSNLRSFAKNHRGIKSDLNETDSNAKMESNSSDIKLGGSIWYVNVNTGNNGNGMSWNTAFESLQEALQAAGNGDQIWIAKGTYVPTTDSEDTYASFRISENGISIYGGFIGTETSVNDRQSPLPETILSGSIGDDNYAIHVVELTGNHVALDGLTISDGYANGASDGENYCLDCFGGGVYILNPESTAADGVYNKIHKHSNPKEIEMERRRKRNEIEYGIEHGIGAAPSNEITYYYTFTEVTFSNNKAIQGGAIFAYCYIDITISDCVFENNEAFDGTNHAGGGGAIFITYHSTLTVSNTEFSSNKASTAGGAINIDYGITATFTGCTFTSNYVDSGHGGAIYITDRASNSGDTTLIADDCTFTSNYAAGWGGAIFMYYDSVGQLNGNTFTSNTAGLAGGAMGLYNVQCWACCDSPGPNTFSGNTGGGGQYSNNNCYEDEFNYVGTTAQHTDATQYLETLWNQKNSNNEPEELENQVYVDGSKTTSGDGFTWATAVKTLQEGITLAVAEGPAKTEVWVRGGSDITYYPTEVPSWYNKTALYWDPSKAKMVYLREFVNIYGGFAGSETKRSQRNWYSNPTTISGKLESGTEVYQVVYMEKKSYIDGFIIRNGHGYEGGIMMKDPKLRISPKTGKPISDPFSQNLGRNSNPNDVLYNKDPNRGTGIFANATCSMQNMVIIDNYSWKGAGIYVLDHTVEAINVAIAKNWAEYRGGGVAVDEGGTWKCTDCIYDKNGCSRKGGGMYLDYACTSYNTNAIWTQNTALDSGGALCIDGAGKAYVTSNTVRNNSAFMEGAAMYAGSYNPYSPRPNIWYLTDNTFEDNWCTTGMGHDQSFLWNYDYIDESGIYDIYG